MAAKDWANKTGLSLFLEFLEVCGGCSCAWLGSHSQGNTLLKPMSFPPLGNASPPSGWESFLPQSLLSGTISLVGILDETGHMTPCQLPPTWLNLAPTHAPVALRLVSSLGTALWFFLCPSSTENIPGQFSVAQTQRAGVSFSRWHKMRTPLK